MTMACTACPTIWTLRCQTTCSNAFTGEALPHRHPRLAADAVNETRAIVQDVRNSILLSAASAWEIAINYRLGKLPPPEPSASYVPDRMRRCGTSPLSVDHAHTAHRRASGSPSTSIRPCAHRPGTAAWPDDHPRRRPVSCL
ncbi:type II toxin-antitoxin system VapC family toxin [Mycobacterium tuberculosis]|uniref:type II toxin-antitoxin system VapC family toxin n=1 Tax=Mycobacterium tuberculosis TaxID=1773 RepID=UPI000999C30F|nr:type II toxin-antitoxin system VapC family toxin [Mycobacterium tuberculosis]